MSAVVCDWCGSSIDDGIFLETESAAWHPECALRAVIWMWASRPMEGELPRPIDDRHVRALNSSGLCAYCYRSLGTLPERRLQALACRECAEHWAGLDDLPERQPDPLVPFLRRLGRESAQLGIDENTLARAVRRARCA